ncbi:MAG: hypothetical protein ACOYVD_03465 [Bacillota bacterium]
MDFRYISSHHDKQMFLKFTKQVYKNDPRYRDSMSGICSMFLFAKTSYLKHGKFYPFLMEEGGKIIARGAFINDNKQKDILMLSFLETLPKGQKIMDLILEEGRKLAKEANRKKIIIGLDGHLNYGLGFLASHFNCRPTFGFSYNPPYYMEYLRNLKEYNFTSFMVDLSKFALSKEMKILERIKKRGFSFRTADFKKFRREIGIYTWLNNECFRDHLWWAERTTEEDEELLNPFRWFIKGENLIIAEKDGYPIGLLLWYPDFNQIIPAGKEISFKTLISYRLGAKIDRFKIAEIAVLPQYRGSGIAVGFFEILANLVGDKYKYCEAGWIEESNLPSKGLGIRWQELGCEQYKRYKAFEVQV